MGQEKTQERHTETRGQDSSKESERDRREHIYRIHKISRPVLTDAYICSWFAQDSISISISMQVLLGSVGCIWEPSA